IPLTKNGQPLTLPMSRQIGTILERRRSDYREKQWGRYDVRSVAFTQPPLRRERAVVELGISSGWII
ncbi:MAG: hypothetical protein ABUJ98_15540, partial [Hyphomicrobium sp.]